LKDDSLILDAIK